MYQSNSESSINYCLNRGVVQLKKIGKSFRDYHSQTVPPWGALQFLRLTTFHRVYRPIAYKK